MNLARVNHRPHVSTLERSCSALLAMGVCRLSAGSGGTEGGHPSADHPTPRCPPAQAAAEWLNNNYRDGGNLVSVDPGTIGA